MFAASAQAAETNSISANFKKISPFNLLRFYAVKAQAILVITPEAIHYPAEISIQTNGTKSVVLTAIESAITNQTSVRLKKTSDHRITATAPTKPLTPATNRDVAGMIDLQGADSSQALQLYGKLGGFTLILTPGALTDVGRIRCRIESKTRASAAEQLGAAITNQTKLKLTPLDKEIVAVTVENETVPGKD